MHAQSFTQDGPASVYARIDAYNGLFSVALVETLRWSGVLSMLQ